jgi:glycosyltransferase involved in cell wall biosynthesis
MRGVSVIIPVRLSTDPRAYNLLAGAMASVRRQQGVDQIQLILVDDGSPPEASRSLAEMFEIIRESDDVLVSAAPCGAQAARNTGAMFARHSYLIFQDSDFIFEECAVSQLLDGLMDDPEAAYAYGDMMLQADESSSVRLRSQPFRGDKLRSGNYIGMPSLIRNECFIGFDEDIERFQDWDMWLGMLEAGMRGVYTGSLVGTHFISRDSISHSVDGKKAREVILEKHRVNG